MKRLRRRLAKWLLGKQRFNLPPVVMAVLWDETFLTWDGLDEAVVGMTTCDGSLVAVYDYQKMIEVFAREMDEDDAVEYVDYNIVGAYIGKQTPIILYAEHFVELNASSFEVTENAFQQSLPLAP